MGMWNTLFSQNKGQAGIPPCLKGGQCKYLQPFLSITSTSASWGGGLNRLDAPKICSILFLFRWSEHKRHFLSTWLFHGGQCPLSKIGVCACKIICRAALSALMRCHLPSLIAPPPMLITYNCPRAGWLLVFPDGDVLVKRFHMILTFPSNRGHHEVSFFLSQHVTN